jgi:hypothetical protein
MNFVGTCERVCKFSVQCFIKLVGGGQTYLIMLLISFLSQNSYMGLRAEVVNELDLGCVVSFERAVVDLAESLAG